MYDGEVLSAVCGVRCARRLGCVRCVNPVRQDGNKQGVCVCACVCVRACTVYVCLCVHMFVCACVCLCTGAWVCVCVQGCVRLQGICVNLSLSLRRNQMKYLLTPLECQHLRKCSTYVSKQSRVLPGRFFSWKKCNSS